MNKYHEAFILTKNETLIDCPKYKITEADCSCDNQKGCKYKQAVETIQELVDKEKPKKPKQEFDDIICPRCNIKFNVYDNCTESFMYCPNCGGKWSDE